MQEPKSNLLPVQLASQLTSTGPQTRWLIQGLWTEQAVGILGGEPKCCKSFLALDMAVSVASGRPCLRHFPVCQRGPVLLFPAEDSLSVVRQRLEGICVAAGTDFASLPVQVITAPSLRLDLVADRQRLASTVEALSPKLLILDPLIRLHQADENESSQMAPLLSGLRQLQRRFHVAVLVVHHAKKEAHSLRPGQALRGSSELHGWGDSNLYLRRKRDRLSLCTEHRAAPSQDHLALELVDSGTALALSLVNSDSPPGPSAPDPPSSDQRILQALASLNRPTSVKELRKLCGIKTATLCAALAQLRAEGLVHRQTGGYRLANVDNRTVSQFPLPIGPEGNGNGKRPST